MSVCCYPCCCYIALSPQNVNRTIGPLLERQIKNKEAKTKTKKEKENKKDRKKIAKKDRPTFLHFPSPSYRRLTFYIPFVNTVSTSLSLPWLSFMELRADDNRVFMAFSVLFVFLAALSTQRLGEFYFTTVTFLISDDFGTSTGGGLL